MNKQIELKNVSLTLKNQDILQNISFAVNHGEDVLITGPSGSGKSTLLKIIATLLSPTNGQLIFEDHDVAKLNPIDYRKQVSYCFQTPQLFGTSVYDNFMFPSDIRNETFQEVKAFDLLEDVGLSKNFLSKDVHELSGGEKQRVALVRNVLFLPKVLLLDEVTSALDDKNAEIIQLFLQRLNKEKGITLIRVSHVAKEIQQASRVLTIKSGRLMDEND